jgi:hypothetical protein
MNPISNSRTFPVSFQQVPSSAKKTNATLERLRRSREGRTPARSSKGDDDEDEDEDGAGARVGGGDEEGDDIESIPNDE